MTDAASDARILDAGYLPYHGPRRGVGGAMRAVMRQAAQRSMGWKRSAGAKVFPILAIALAYLPAIAFVGIAILAKDQLARQQQQIIPRYGQYYGFVWGAILLFTAFVAPGVLCTDRRNGLLGFSLASPLNRTTYLIAKAGGVGAILLFVTLGPPLVLLLGNTFNNTGPDGFTEWLATFGRILVAGVLMTALSLTFSMAVSSTTTRWAAASAAIVVVFFATTVLVPTLIRRGGAAPELFALDIVQMPIELVLRLFGETRGQARVARRVSTEYLVAAYVALTLAFALFTRWRYSRIRATR